MSDDDGTFSFRLVDEHGRPVSDRKITIDYGFMRGVGSEYTDDDGWAEFPTLGYSVSAASHSDRASVGWSTSSKLRKSASQEHL